MPTRILTLLTTLSCILTTLSITGQNTVANKIFGRKYAPGEVYRYRLTTIIYMNGMKANTTESVCELIVVTDSAGIPYDEIRWISKQDISFDTISHTPKARMVQPYRISLHPEGRLDIPVIDVAGMTGEITDFNTFFVAVSPKMGIGTLSKTGDSYIKNDMVRGNFANGKDILQGDDCLAVSLLWQKESDEDVTIQTSFQPPAQPCLQYLQEYMLTPVAKDTLNNFQMIRKDSKEEHKWGIMYGREDFTITTTLLKKDGRIKSAVMDNFLLLKGKLGCDIDLNNCTSTLPYAIRMHRHLLLELME